VGLFGLWFGLRWEGLGGLGGVGGLFICQVEVHCHFFLVLGPLGQLGFGLLGGGHQLHALSGGDRVGDRRLQREIHYGSVLGLKKSNIKFWRWGRFFRVAWGFGLR
jgi:hypothetical protein